MLQTLFTNSLTNPFFLGTASGASLGGGGCCWRPALPGEWWRCAGWWALWGVVPHLARGLSGTTGCYKWGAAICWCARYWGGVLLLACDLLARLLYPPAGLLVGSVTALFGVPFFVYLLRKNN